MDTTLIKAFVVPSRNVKTVKDKLEEQGLLHKRIKIAPCKGDHDQKLMLIPTTQILGSRDPSQCDIRLHGEDEAYLEYLEQTYRVTTIDQSGILQEQQKIATRNSFHEAAKDALLEIPEAALYSVSANREELLETLPTAYSIYAPMLLLPCTVLTRPAWKSLIEKAGIFTSREGRVADMQPFFAKLAQAMSTTHIAINAPIPTDIDTAQPDVSERFSSSNVLRSPTNLVVLHGDFGPDLQPFPRHIPTQIDFEQAFWVSTTQNGIKQTWAPRYTMFSKGNVTEKARLLSLKSVTSLKTEAWTAVDLFAGIGYFAFSYARAGASRVLCWDLNPWSTEGLCRGAALNKWDVTNVLAPSDTTNAPAGTCTAREPRDEATLLVYCESNSMAYGRVQQLRGSVPPVRHVNCGMLPSAGEAWKTAVRCLDWQLGGWLHLHETVRESGIAERTEEIRLGVEKLLHELESSRNGAVTGFKKQASVEHVERVKSVGPRMLHVVVDLKIS